MPDITMCTNNEKRAKRKSCYRATAIPSERQSYANFWNNFNDCDYFWFNGVGDENKLSYEEDK